MKKEKSKVFYVTMSDSFLSGWGMAEDRINKLVFPCETLKLAQGMMLYAKSRSDMKHVNIQLSKPCYPKDRYYAQIKTKEDYSFWFEMAEKLSKTL